MSKLLPVIILIVFALGCTKTSKLGSKNNPVKLYFTPSVDSEVIATNSQKFIEFLEKETGHFYKTGIPTNYIAVVEAFGSERADIGVMNSFGYIMANKKYGATAKLTAIRYGKDYYRGQILAHVDSKVKNIKDLAGKRFAFTDPSSTSGYMFPLKILKDNNVKLGNQVFAIKHDNVVTMIYQKQVDAGATYYSAPKDGEIKDARARVKTQFPDVEDKIKIIAITEKIPNDPFVFRKNLPLDISDKFIKAVMKFLSTKEGKRLFGEIYSIEGVIPSTDKDYDGLRTMIKSINLDTEKLL